MMEYKTKISETTLICPCGSNKKYTDCCGIYHTGQYPPSAEKLMRARYSAYALAKIDFITASMCNKAALNFNPINAKQWAEQCDWLKLTIISTKIIQAQQASVTFVAQYKYNAKNQYLYEKSIFEKINGKWYYTTGKTMKIGRNSSCPCGCNKKFKQHLGKN